MAGRGNSRSPDLSGTVIILLAVTSFLRYKLAVYSLPDRRNDDYYGNFPIKYACKYEHGKKYYSVLKLYKNVMPNSTFFLAWF
jgi:hypothetical protein